MTTPRIADLAVELETSVPKARRAADILDVVAAQVFGDPSQSGTGFDFSDPAEPHLVRAVDAVLAGTGFALTAVGVDPRGWAR